MPQIQSPKETQPAVSIIVPVCNVERYLEECLDGLHLQTLESIEIILIDDGSTDSSPQILSREAQKDPRMRVITKPNGGYGSGINRGLSEARGEYIGIVEPDDRIDPHMYEELYAAAKENDDADIVKSSYWEYYDLPEASWLQRPNVMNRMPKTLFTANIYEKYELLRHHPSIWSGIYRRAFLEEHGVRMIEAPGGGWVDNPFFFETFLQAKTYVWLPGAYYYYRQTNPDSSSNLKNYHVPYERLRDIRDLFARLNVTDPNILSIFYARHFFYTYSVLGEWGHAENDPELKTLIHEAMAALDPDILYGGYPGIRPEYIAFYESVMKDPAHEIAARAASDDPKISVIVPVCDDRHVLIRTLSQIAAQTMSDIEILCVDCDSIDVSAAICGDFAEKDARFRLIRLSEPGRAAGLEAGLEAACAPLSAVIFPGQNVPENYLEKAADTMQHNVQLGLFLSKKARVYCPWENSTDVSVPGHEAQLLLCAAENTSRIVYRTAFLREYGIKVHQQDDAGEILLLETICRAHEAAVYFGDDVPSGSSGRRMKAREASLTDMDRYLSDREVLDEMYRCAQEIGERAVAAFRNLAVRRMLDDTRKYICSRQGAQIFKDLQECFFSRYGILDARRGIQCNMEAFLVLEEFLSASYEEALRRTAREARGSAGSMKRRYAALRNNRWYRLLSRIRHTFFGRKQA